MRGVLLLLSDHTYDFCMADEMGKKIPLTYTQKEGTFTYTVWNIRDRGILDLSNNLEHPSNHLETTLATTQCTNEHLSNSKKCPS